METAGIGLPADAEQSMILVQQLKRLLELQGELVVKLIESSGVPGPSDTSVVPGMGAGIDVHV